MVRYGNLAGNSGVYAYEIGDNSVKVEFKDGSIYLYNYHSTGSYNIEHMKQLAVRGQGLNSFINTTVRKNYASKLR